jgi:hypothetical protein
MATRTLTVYLDGANNASWTAPSDVVLESISCMSPANGSFADAAVTLDPGFSLSSISATIVLDQLIAYFNANSGFSKIDFSHPVIAGEDVFFLADSSCAISIVYSVQLI